jgi:hypothetical protein
MKKFAFIFSVLILAVVFSAGSAAAQNVSKVGVNIPFEFNFGGKAYAAGRYIVRVKSNTGSTAVVTLSDEAGKDLQSVIATMASHTSDEDAKLLFGKANGQSALTGLALPNQGYDIPGSNSGKPAYTKNRRESHKEKTKTKST